MVECAGNMALINDDDRYEPNIITALKRPENVRVMNVWGRTCAAAHGGNTILLGRPLLSENQ
jgi:hypothetical protein